MKNKESGKSWVERKLEKRSFRKSFDSESDKLSIGEDLTRLRQKANLTQAQLAKKVGTTASAISRYENAEYDRYEVQTLRKIAAACGGSVKISFEEEAA